MTDRNTDFADAMNGIDINELLHHLGPFEPPADFDHGGEFSEPVPRAIPARLKTGSANQRHRNRALAVIAAGAACVITAPVPLVRELGWYVLPFGWLMWIGLGLCAIGGALLLWNRLFNRREDYVRRGVPIIGRILHSGGELKSPNSLLSKDETVRIYLYAIVQYRDPHTDRLELAKIESLDNWNPRWANRLRLDLGLNRYVTLVAIPPDIGGTLQIYGLLGLDPERELILLDDQPITGKVSVLKSVRIFLLVGCLVLLVSVYGSARAPLTHSLPIMFQFMAGGSLVVMLLLWFHSRQLRKRGFDTRFRPGCLESVSILFFGAVLGLLPLNLINSLFDRSPAAYEIVSIADRQVVTDTQVFRSYVARYKRPGDTKPRKIDLLHDDFDRLGNARLAVLETHAGNLGVRWMKAMHPLRWDLLPGQPDAEELRSAITLTRPPGDNQPEVSARLVPRMVVNQAGETTPLPDTLLDSLRQQLQDPRLRDAILDSHP